MPRTGGQTRLGSEGKEAPYGGPVRGDIRSGVLDSRAIPLWPSPPPSDHLPWAGRLFLLSTPVRISITQNIFNTPFNQIP